MILKIALVLLTLSKDIGWVSTFVQMFFILFVLLQSLIKFQDKIRLTQFIRQDCFFIVSVFSLLLFISVANSSNYLYSFKNIAYILTMPLLPYVLSRKWCNENEKFVFLLTTISLFWYQISPESYITEQLLGTPRMIGYGVNPNVFGLLCLIILVMNNKSKSLDVFFKHTLTFLLLSSIILSKSQTAIILLPLCFSRSFNSSILYSCFLVFMGAVIFVFLGEGAAVYVPSLLQRFDLWSNAFDGFNLSNLFFGKGYDFFGAGIGTLANDEIKIVDSFFIASFVSGGIGLFFIIARYYFFIPIKWAIVNKSYTMFNIVLIFFISNFFGNFLENGFPANVIYWISIKNLMYEKINIQKNNLTTVKV